MSVWLCIKSLRVSDRGGVQWMGERKGQERIKKKRQTLLWSDIQVFGSVGECMFKY